MSLLHVDSDTVVGCSVDGRGETHVVLRSTHDQRTNCVPSSRVNALDIPCSDLDLCFRTTKLSAEDCRDILTRAKHILQEEYGEDSVRILTVVALAHGKHCDFLVRVRILTVVALAHGKHCDFLVLPGFFPRRRDGYVENSS